MNQRYIRQQNLPAMVQEFTHKLAKSSVLLLGAGGLGCPASIYLAAAGVGRITVVDRDIVTPSNLNRQILYTPDDVGSPKAILCAQRIHAQNPDCDTYPIVDTIDATLLNELVPAHDIVMDCCDNHATRTLIAQACQRSCSPCIVSAVRGLEGFVFTVVPPHSACYGCLYPQHSIAVGSDPQVLGAAAGTIGSMAASRCMLALTEKKSDGILMHIDLVTLESATVPLTKNPSCPVCSRQTCH